MKQKWKILLKNIQKDAKDEVRTRRKALLSGDGTG